MSIDELEAQLASQTWQERVEASKNPTCLNLNTQFKGNRVVSRFFPEQWAKVQIARHQLTQHGDTNVAG